MCALVVSLCSALVLYSFARFSFALANGCTNGADIRMLRSRRWLVVRASDHYRDGGEKRLVVSSRLLLFLYHLFLISISRGCGVFPTLCSPSRLYPATHRSRVFFYTVLSFLSASVLIYLLTNSNGAFPAKYSQSSKNTFLPLTMISLGTGESSMACSCT